jgi:hypothetical protein
MDESSRPADLNCSCQADLMPAYPSTHFEGDKMSTNESSANVMSEADRLAGGLFDAQALLESMAANIELMRLEDGINYDVGGMLTRVLRVSIGKIEAVAVQLADSTIDVPLSVRQAV